MEIDQVQSDCKLICLEQYGSSEKKNKFLVQNGDQTIRKIDISSLFDISSIIKSRNQSCSSYEHIHIYLYAHSI